MGFIGIRGALIVISLWLLYYSSGTIRPLLLPFANCSFSSRFLFSFAVTTFFLSPATSFLLLSLFISLAKLYILILPVL